MRKVLYISIAISLLIVAAAVVHYNWRADQLREPLAQIPDSAAPGTPNRVRRVRH